jgi:sulfur-oxidizing protein SoxB
MRAAATRWLGLGRVALGCASAADHTTISHWTSRAIPEARGAEIVRLIEDVADNLLHPDPYYRQGGDMVGVGGLSYVIDPAQPIGRRIRDVRVGGRALEPGRRYRATGWASLGEADGPPAWDVVADHLRALKRVRLEPRPRVRVLSE